MIGQLNNYPLALLVFEGYTMRKFQVTIQFQMNDDFAALVPSHRTYINRLISKGVIDHYVVTMETQRDHKFDKFAK
jgi:hypothetical protein